MNRLLAAIVVIVTPALAAMAQTTPAFRSGVELVQLDVSVTRGGAPVRGLTASDFTVLDHGVRRDIQSATTDRLPLDVQLVVDVSESVAGERLTHLVAAGRGLLNALKPGDRVALLAFSDIVSSRVAMTDDFAAVSRSLSTMVPSGQTALRDAVQVALALPRPGDRRTLIIVFTDGVDNSSWLSEEEVLDSARRSGVVVDVVRVGSRELSWSRFVERLPEVSGGKGFSAASARDLESLFTKALEEMRARYLLVFSPPRPNRPGWHELKIELKDLKGEVTARPGYFVNQR